MPKKTMRTGDIYFQNQFGKNKKKTPESWCFCNFISMAGMKRTDSSAAIDDIYSGSMFLTVSSKQTL